MVPVFLRLMRKLALSAATLVGSICPTVACGAETAVEILSDGETAVDGIVVAGDKERMNWLLATDGSQYPWVDSRYGWGTGTFKIDGRLHSWSGVCETGGVRVSVSRSVTKGVLEERYEFVNVTNRALALSEIDIHTPFNDNFPSSGAEKFRRRCFAHVWPGGSAGWVSAMRIGGYAPHIGLAVTDGNLSGYALKERSRKTGSSDFRGVIALSPASAGLGPGERTAIAWKVFAHAGWDDFFAKTVQLGGADVRADRYVAMTGEVVRVTARTAEGTWTRDWKCPAPGDHRVEIEYGVAARRRRAHVEILGIADVGDLLLSRARFIVHHQQINAPGSPYDGAFVPYDCETGRQIRLWEQRPPRPPDFSEGGERIGMGVFLAMMAQRGHQAEFMPSVLRYARFLRESLQGRDYTSWQEVRRPSRARAFNYPWFIRFYLEMHALTLERRYLDDALGTFRRLFSGRSLRVPDSLVEFQISPLVSALRKAGEEKAAAEVVSTAGKWLGRAMSFDGGEFVTHEVGLSPDMITSTIWQLLDYWELSGETGPLEAAKRWMAVAEANCGRQPSWHLHDMGLQHWNGYWFGKRKHWGDTMPHDWDGILAGAFVRYARATGDKSREVRARGVAAAMLGLFSPDGRATAAWIYPDRVNGSPVKGPDPMANDQDWALVYFLEIFDFPNQRKGLLR